MRTEDAMSVFRLLIILLLAYLSVFGQAGQNDPNVKELADKIKTRSTHESMEAILAAGRSGNKNFIPFLQTIAEPEEVSYAFKTIPSYAQVALAMLGEKGYLWLILQEVDSEDIFLQNTGIEKLSLVGGPTAFKTFFRLLDEVQLRREKASAEDLEYARIHGFTLRTGDEILEPRSILAMRKLSTMVIDPPVSPAASPTLDDIKIWKEWFIQHQDLI